MKKGQIRLIFTWIFILVLAGLILIYGVKNIKNVVDLGEDAIIVNFFNKLDDKVQLFYSLDVDSTSIEEFKLTNKINYVCFAKTYNFPDTDFEFLDKKERDFLRSFRGYDDNVFVIPYVYEKNREKIDNLDLIKDECFEVINGVLRVKLITTPEGVSIEGE